MFIADLHIHSKYSRATSRDCVPEMLDFWARRKGIQVVGTGDFTHRVWREELRTKLTPTGDGVYGLKAEYRQATEVAGAEAEQPRFIVSGEISSIYKKNGKVRKVHNLILLPSLEYAESIARKLETVGNVHSDGRPILGLDSRDLLEIVLELCPEAFFVPAHIWTPHFSLFGAYSGFDDIEECFGDLTKHIYALETGLSSDPPMNWRWSALDRFALISNSDAHSPANLGREANLFDCRPEYPAMLRALKEPDRSGFHGTIEFFPEEGKYHYDGHRNCHVCCKPAETIAAGGVCPVCGGRITVGVLHRIEALADRPEGTRPVAAKFFERLSPLSGVIAASIGASTASRKVHERYEELLRNFGPEFTVLRTTPLNDLAAMAGPCISEGIRRLRSGQVEWQPGYDGEYGKMHLFDPQEMERLAGQQCLFADAAKTPAEKKSRQSKRAADRRGGQTAVTETSLGNNVAKPADSYPYGLNAAQWGAITAEGPATAVIAGPGTGKTKTLVCRIAYLIEQRGIAAKEITAVTFTNKAAKEMRSRLAGQLGGKRAAGVTVGTFHSLCLEKLSAAKAAERPILIDEYQALAIVTELAKELKLKGSSRDILRGISLAKCGALPEHQPGQVADTIVEAYNRRLAEYGVMDYDDILLQALQKSESGEPEESCRYLLVDEFQDINETQYRLIKQWSRLSQNVFIIGDPDQSIYGFRGSDYRYFGRFAIEFPAVCECRLHQNYRSTPEIVSAARRIIASPSRGETVDALTASRASGAKVRNIEAASAYQEAVFVAKEVAAMVGGLDMLNAHAASGRPVSDPVRGFADIAVLYRTNRQAEFLEQCLQQEGIPHVVAGREEYLAEPMVRAALAFFKLLLSPGDLASFHVCLTMVSGLDAGLREKLMAAYAGGEKNLVALQKLLKMLVPAVRPDSVVPSLPDLLAKFGPGVHDAKPAELIETWINDYGQAGQPGLEKLRNMAVLHGNMASLLQNLTLGTDGDFSRSGSKVYTSDAVSLMTMHAAKGLEFPVVFICGVNEGTIPWQNSIEAADLAEERRLFYVGLTRAKDELILLTSGTPSPFLTDLPQNRLSVEQAFDRRQSGPFQGKLFGD